MTPSNQPRRTVLVVEDDPDYCELLRGAFAEAGFQTLRALNGDRALQMMRSEPVDLVVSDFMMPEVNGLELCRRLSEDNQLGRYRIVLYSVNGDPSIGQRARELGALDYLPKSENTADMVRQVSGMIEAISHRQSPWARMVEQVAQIRPRLNSLDDFLQVVGLSSDLPQATRAVLGAAQRNVGEIQRLVDEVHWLAAQHKPEV